MLHGEGQVTTYQTEVDDAKDGVQNRGVAIVKTGERRHQGMQAVDHGRDHRDAEEQDRRQVVPDAGDRPHVTAVG